MKALVLLIAFVAIGSALELDDVKEGGCVQPPIYKKFDKKWFESYKGYWYLPISSKYEYYRMLEATLEKKINNITYEETKDYCAHFHLDGHITTFRTKKQFFEMTWPRHGIFEWEFKGLDEFKANEISFITWSDNKNLVFVMNFYPDEKLGHKEIGWSVISNHRTLSKWELKSILDHVESFGLRRDNYEIVDYSKCVFDKDDLNF